MGDVIQWSHSLLNYCFWWHSLGSCLAKVSAETPTSPNTSWNFFWIFSVDSFVCLRTETIVLYHNVKLFPLKKISYFAHSRKSLQGIKAGFAPILNKKLTEKFYNRSQYPIWIFWNCAKFWEEWSMIKAKQRLNFFPKSIILSRCDISEVSLSARSIIKKATLP